jgi:outer membrane murein-binding lipoprotein Lpp
MKRNLLTSAIIYSLLLIGCSSNNIVTTFTEAADGANCKFQTSAGDVKGLAANLENYSGQTVDVIFAAVPRSDTSTLQVFAVAQGVSVP